MDLDYESVDEDKRDYNPQSVGLEYAYANPVDSIALPVKLPRTKKNRSCIAPVGGTEPVYHDVGPDITSGHRGILSHSDGRFQRSGGSCFKIDCYEIPQDAVKSKNKVSVNSLESEY